MANLATLTFDNTTLDIIDRNGQQWLQSPQIAMALGYKQENAVTKIFNRNEDEFTEEMVSFIDLPKLGKQRIFSPRGAHLIAMFARTDKAKAFRKWVLDVLDAVLPYGEPQASTIERLSPEQKGALQSIMSARCAEIPADQQGSARSRLWKMINSMAGVNSYHEIPASRFMEVREALLNVQPVKLNTYEQPKLEKEDAKPFYYPEEDAKPSGDVSMQSLLTLRVLRDELYKNPLDALLKELRDTGHNINGAEIVYKAMLHIMDVQSNTLRNIADRASGGAGVGYKYYVNKKPCNKGQKDLS